MATRRLYHSLASLAFCVKNPFRTCGFPSQEAINEESVSMGHYSNDISMVTHLISPAKVSYDKLPVAPFTNTV